MPRLFAPQEDPISIGPALFSMAALMILLLPTLILGTSTQKFTSLPLAIAGSSEERPLDPNRTMDRIHLKIEENELVLRAWVRQTDIRAGERDVEEKTWRIQSKEALLSLLQQLKQIDPAHKRIEIQPHRGNRTDEVVRWMDIVQKSPDGELFPEILIESSQ